MKISDFLHAVGVGLEVLGAIEQVEVEGKPGTVEISVLGHKFNVTVTPVP